MRIGGRVAVIVVGPIRGHLPVLTAIGLHLSDGNTAGGDINHDRTVRIRCRAAHDNRVCADETVCTTERSLAGIGVAHHDADHVILCHAVAVVASAADIRTVAPHTCGNAILPGTFEHRIIDPVYRCDTRAAAAVKSERRVCVFHTAEVGLRHQGTCHVLPQIDAEAG